MAVLLALIVIGILLILAGQLSRRRHGLTDAHTLDIDGRTLYSPGLRLSGRPDRIVEEDGMPIPEEWKPEASRVYKSHLAQLGTYFILIEEETGIRPTHGYIKLQGDRRERIENTVQLRVWVVAIAEEIRAMRRNPREPIKVRQPAAKCRGCGVREGCGQRRG